MTSQLVENELVNPSLVRIVLFDIKLIDHVLVLEIEFLVVFEVVVARLSEI
jgi:hypothetical protein